MAPPEAFDWDDKEPHNFGWREGSWLLAMSSVLILGLASSSSYVAALPFIRDEWNMTNTQSGIVFSAYLIGYAISSLLLVPITDRVPPMRVLLCSITVISATNVLFPMLADNFWVGTGLRLLSGAGHVGVYVPGIQMVSSRYAHQRRGTAVGIFVSGGYTGFTLSYLLMGLFLDRVASWQVAYMITALVGLAAVPIALLLARSTVYIPRSPIDDNDRGLTVWLDLKVLMNRPVMMMILAYALHAAELYIARLWLPMLLVASLVHSGLDSLDATASGAFLSGLMFMTGIPAVVLGGMISDKFGRTSSAALLFTISGVCSFAMGWLVDMPPGFLIVFGFLYGFFTAADSAIYSTALTELAPVNRIGSTQSVQAFVGFTVGAVAPVAAGYLLDLSNTSAGWGMAFSMNGLVALLGVGILMSLRRLPESTRMANGQR